MFLVFQVGEASARAKHLVDTRNAVLRFVKTDVSVGGTMIASQLRTCNLGMGRCSEPKMFVEVFFFYAIL